MDEVDGHVGSIPEPPLARGRVRVGDVTSFPDQFQKVTAQLLADTEYRAKLGKAGDVFIEGRTTDVMMQLI